MKILITSGGCKAPIDDVRHVGNSSSGRYGCCLFEDFHEKLEYGDHVILFHEKGSIVPGEFWYSNSCVGEADLDLIQYKNYEEYLGVKDYIQHHQPDIIISSAAISDYIPVKQEGKISSDQDELIIRLVKAEKVIHSFRNLAPNALIVGFKLLHDPTECEKEEAIRKALKHSDLVVYNDLKKLREGDSRRYVYFAVDAPPIVANTPNCLASLILDYKDEPF